MLCLFAMVAPEPTPPSQPAQSDAARNVEDIEKELELDLENLNIDENIDTSVSGGCE